jgi:hypothetical protein
VRLTDLGIDEPGQIFDPELLRVWMQADGLATSRHGRQRCDACGTSIVGHEGSAPRALQSYADAVALSRLRE